MTHLNRSIVLRGPGGAVVAAPFLGSLFERSLKAEVTPARKRTIVRFTHDGCITERWFRASSTVSSPSPTSPRPALLPSRRSPRSCCCCNIMNAMGIEADANGYAAQDGPNSEVPHYGYSDKTEDFSGGKGAVPGATLRDPGGFTALRA